MRETTNRFQQALDYQKNNGGRVEKHCFEARLEIDGALPRGLWFRAIVFPRSLDSGTFSNGLRPA
jgi:hypothetical protein